MIYIYIYIYIYVYVYIYCKNKNDTNTNCLRFDDPILISKKDSQDVVSDIQNAT